MLLIGSDSNNGQSLAGKNQYGIESSDCPSHVHRVQSEEGDIHEPMIIVNGNSNLVVHHNDTEENESQSHQLSTNSIGSFL